MYKQDLVLNNLKWLMCHKTQPNPTKPNHILDIYMCGRICTHTHTHTYIYGFIWFGFITHQPLSCNIMAEGFRFIYLAFGFS